jgi:hypothetical protein
MALVINHYAHDWYGPVPDKDAGFPLQLVWETKLSENIKEVHITENENLLIRLGYSVNLISPKTGDLIWKFRIDEPISTATAYNENLFVISKNNVFALSEGNGEIIWKSVFNSIGSPEFSYVDAHNLLTVSYGNIDVYNTKNGELEKEYYSGRGQTKTCFLPGVFFTFIGQIEAYTFEDGERLWVEKSFHNPEEAVCKNEMAYFVENNSKLIAYDLEAKNILWVKNFPPKDPYTLKNIFSVGDLLVVEGINNIFIVSITDGSIINTLSLKEGLTKSSLITSVAAIKNNLYLFDGFSQSIYSFDMTTWKQTGSLHLSFPNIVSTETERFINIDDMLILWKNNRLIAYK